MGTSGTQLGRVPPGAVEHRLFPRARVLNQVSIELPSGKTCWLHDLAMGGLRVRGALRLDVGTSALVRFRLPQTDSEINATGIVIWSDDEGRSGIRFSEMQPDSHSALRKWLEYDNSAAVKGSASDDSVLESRIASLAEVSELQAEIASRQLDCAAALDRIVRRMMELAGASGAAIALRDGENVICRASAGNAPDVGVKLSLSSLSGECFRTGSMVLLNDSENDPRVDPALCRQLNFRSLLILPISLKSEVVGIAEVLSPNAHNFEGGEVLILSLLADVIAGVAAPQEEHDGSESTLPNILEIAGSELLDLPHDGEGGVGMQVLASPLEQEVQTSDAFGSGKIGAVLVDEPAISAPSELRSLSVQESVATAARVRALSSLSASPTSATTTLAINDVATSLPHIGSGYADTPKPRGTTWRISIAAATVGLLISGGLFFSYHRRPSAVTGTATLAASAPTSAQEVSKPPATSTSPASFATPAANASTKALVPAAPEPKLRKSEITKPQSLDDTLPELRVIAGKSAKPNPNPALENAPEAPQLATLAGNSFNNLPASVVTAKTPNPRLQVQQSQGVTAGKLLKRVLPRYPEDARRAGISGDVVLAATIGTDGMLHNLKLISGSPVLRGEALAAARQWRYEPAMLSGKPVETDTRITISFQHQ